LTDEQKAELGFLANPSKEWTASQIKILQNYYKDHTKSNNYRGKIKLLREELGGYGQD
jgi:hypothetical protein